MSGQLDGDNHAVGVHYSGVDADSGDGGDSGVAGGVRVVMLVLFCSELVSDAESNLFALALRLMHIVDGDCGEANWPKERNTIQLPSDK